MIDNAELCRPYTNENGKKVAGAAAFAHYVFTECGGIQNYNNEVGTYFVNAFSDAIHEEMLAEERRQQFHLVS